MNDRFPIQVQLRGELLAILGVTNGNDRRDAGMGRLAAWPLHGNVGNSMRRQVAIVVIDSAHSYSGKGRRAATISVA